MAVMRSMTSSSRRMVSSSSGSSRRPSRYSLHAVQVHGPGCAILWALSSDARGQVRARVGQDSFKKAPERRAAGAFRQTTRRV